MNNEAEWLPTMEVAYRLGVSTDILRTWSRWKTFPEGLIVRDGGQNFLGCAPTLRMATVSPRGKDRKAGALA